MLPDIQTIENAARISMGDYDPPAECEVGPLPRRLVPGYWIVGLLLAAPLLLAVV